MRVSPQKAERGEGTILYRTNNVLIPLGLDPKHLGMFLRGTFVRMVQAVDERLLPEDPRYHLAWRKRKQRDEAREGELLVTYDVLREAEIAVVSLVSCRIDAEIADLYQEYLALQRPFPETPAQGEFGGYYPWISKRPVEQPEKDQWTLLKQIELLKYERLCLIDRHRRAVANTTRVQGDER